MKSGDATTINIGETSKLAETKVRPAKGTTTTATPVVATSKAITTSTKGRSWRKRPAAVLDFILRIGAFGATLAAATVMGTADQTLPFFTQFFQFHADFSDLPALTFFVVANAIACGYLFLSLAFSFIRIIRPKAVGVRVFLLILDVVMIALTSSGAAAAASIVYLAHNGNPTTNWMAMCQQFDEFCQDISGAVVASFVAAAILILLVIFSALGLRKH
ncbi:hypothetical protein ACHQM5_013771 [Ranunculus cassubicifolius]